MQLTPWRTVPCVKSHSNTHHRGKTALLLWFPCKFIEYLRLGYTYIIGVRMITHAFTPRHATELSRQSRSLVIAITVTWLINCIPQHNVHNNISRTKYECVCIHTTVRYNHTAYKISRDSCQHVHNHRCRHSLTGQVRVMSSPSIRHSPPILIMTNPHPRSDRGLSSDRSWLQG